MKTLQQMVEELALWMNKTEIARRLCVSRVTVYTWLSGSRGMVSPRYESVMKVKALYDEIFGKK